MAKFCINCGNKMDDAHRVCSNCGTPDQLMQGNQQFVNQGQMVNNQMNYEQPMQNQTNYNHSGYGQQHPRNQMNYNNPYYQNNMMNNQQVQEQGIQYGWVVLGFFIPIAGWIMWGMWTKTKPKTAQACGIAGIIGFILGLMII